MSENDALPIPLDIPWRLAAAGQRFQPVASEYGDPNASLALFTYEPQVESLQKNYPDHRVVYVKLTASISPWSPKSTEPEFGPWMDMLIRGGLPVWTAFVDLGLRSVSPIAGVPNPHFLAAAPMRRAMIEAGTIGDNLYEGEASGLAVSKTASQLIEGLKSTTESSSWSAGGFLNLGLIGGGGGGGGSSTTVNASRDVSQRIDMLNRKASEERRELLSHTTRVANVLTLLTAKHIGTPYLQYTLQPRPIRSLIADPSDPNLWFMELLRRRSSGIEGMQDFVAIAAVPRQAGRFCINARLITLHVMAPFQGIPANTSENRLPFLSKMRVIRYLNQVYPPGTPLDDLDADVFDEGTATRVTPDLRSSAIVLRWFYPQPGPFLGSQLGVVRVVYGYRLIPSQGGIDYLTKVGLYKLGAEVLLEANQARAAEMAKSPLRRGQVLAVQTDVRACFDVSDTLSPAGTVGETVEAVAPRRLRFRSPSIRPRRRHASRPEFTARDAVAEFNILAAELEAQATRAAYETAREFRFDDPQVVQMILAFFAGLSPQDPDNLKLDQAASAFYLDQSTVEKLRECGVSDLRTMADLLLHVESYECDATEIQGLRNWLSASPHGKDLQVPEPPALAVNSAKAAAVRAKIGEALQASLQRTLGSLPSTPQAKG